MSMCSSPAPVSTPRRPPFYTGKMKLVDTAGRVDKFYQRYKNRQK